MKLIVKITQLQKTKAVTKSNFKMMTMKKRKKKTNQRRLHLKSQKNLNKTMKMKKMNKVMKTTINVLSIKTMKRKTYLLPYLEMITPLKN